MFEKILVCLDGSKLAEQILPYVEAQALCFQSKVILLEVVAVPGAPFASGATLPVHTSHLMTEQAQRDEMQAKVYLEGVAKSLQAKGLSVECVAQHGDSVGNTIMTYADQNQVDLIAISTHGRSGLTRLISGSVAEFLLRHSNLPLLVIRPKE